MLLLSFNLLRISMLRVTQHHDDLMTIYELFIKEDW